MKDRKVLINRICSIVFIILASVAYIYAIHDMQYAEGGGLYFAIEFGKSNRGIFDLLCDAARVIAIMVLTVIPVIIYKKRIDIYAWIRILSTYLAFIPILRIGDVLELFVNNKMEPLVFLGAYVGIVISWLLWEYIYMKYKKLAECDCLLTMVLCVRVVYRAYDILVHSKLL